MSKTKFRELCSSIAGAMKECFRAMVILSKRIVKSARACVSAMLTKLRSGSGLVTVKFNEATVRRVLTEVGVPASRHAEAWSSLRAGYKRAHGWPLLANLLAPVVVPIALLFTKWEDERLPRWARAWDNDASINGDEFRWVDGKALPVSLSPDDQEAIASCYWAPGHHPRSYWARFVWLALRNRGKWAYQKEVPFPPEQEPELWGTPGITRGLPTVTGWQVRCLGGYWQMNAVLPWKFGRYHEPNWGWKVGLWRLRVLTNGYSRVMCVGVNLKLRKPRPI